MNDPLATISTRATPQNEPIPGTVPNSAGGHAFAVDDWTRLRRFLILGTEGGTYYISERKLTKENADVVFRCAAADGPRTVREIVDVSVNGRAPKSEPAIFALAVCAAAPLESTRREALAALSAVCRIGTHLFIFARYVENFRGWGRGLRSGVADWYTDKTPAALGYDVAKYRQREGWSHRDLLRLAKPRPPRGSETDQVLGWVTGKGPGTEYLRAVDRAQTASTSELLALIGTYGLPWEVLPSESLKSPEIWKALMPRMGLTALIRNLGRMTHLGALGADEIQTIRYRLLNPEALKNARVHPLQILVALRTYASGRGDKGSLTWIPNHRITDALDESFRLAFDAVEPANKRTLVALDVSGSMGRGGIAGSTVTPREGSAAMCLVTLATEPDSHVIGFTDGTIPLSISPRQRLDDVCRYTAGLGFDWTDCAQPMLFALKNKLAFDTFVVYTDSETWAGNIHPVQALRKYREWSGIDAKLIVVGMVSNGFSIADPRDPGMLDVVGFDTSAPVVISNFSAGRI